MPAMLLLFISAGLVTMLLTFLERTLALVLSSVFLLAVTVVAIRENGSRQREAHLDFKAKKDRVLVQDILTKSGKIETAHQLAVLLSNLSKATIESDIKSRPTRTNLTSIIAKMMDKGAKHQGVEKGRVPYERIAGALGMSTQTAAAREVIPIKKNLLRLSI